MSISQRTIDQALVELRRIAAHRTAGAEKAIRSIYKTLLKELRQFLGEAYARMAQEGWLTYAQLQTHGAYARFLEEVERHLSGIAPEIAKEITSLVEQTYALCYDGMVDAVRGAKDAKALRQALAGLHGATPEMVRVAVENPIGGLTLKDTLEWNRREILHDIRREIGIGLTQGDRIEEMARRIARSLDRDYQKSVRIARTEAHRTREAGHYQAAQDIERTLTGDGAGMRLMKTWHTMQDERVRPQRGKRRKGVQKANHRKLEGVSLPVDEAFDLGNGVKAQAPGLSGDAGNDIHCRCFLSYDLQETRETGKLINKDRVLPPDTKTSIAVKLNNYLLNKHHIDGKSKAKWFEEALGFTKENADELGRQIVFDPEKAVQTSVSHYGEKYNQIISITGANGRVLDVRVAWIKNRDGIIRLVTAIPTKKR